MINGEKLNISWPNISTGKRKKIISQTEQIKKNSKKKRRKYKKKSFFGERLNFGFEFFYSENFFGQGKIFFKVYQEKAFTRVNNHSQNHKARPRFSASTQTQAVEGNDTSLMGAERSEVDDFNCLVKVT